VDMTGSRKKTLDHMHHLLAAASLAGACTPTGASKDSGSSVTTGYGVVDPMPPPALDAGVIAPPIVPDADSAKDAGKEGGKTAITMPTIEIKNTTPTVTAYGVVDPMPPPALRTK
jgi:hypothetical protein